jgi:TonB family protein
LACNAETMLRQSLTTPDPAPPVENAAAPEALLVDVVVLTADQELFQSTRQAVGERNPVWRARTADEAADLLITGRCGVLLVDTAAVSQEAAVLIQQIAEQFPDVVICVAGTRTDEPLLAPLISTGLVYRFMHKPTSPRRAGMFLQAAIRRHVEQREGKNAGDPLLPILRGLQRPTAGMPRGYLALIGVAALALTVPLFVGDDPEPLPNAAATSPPAASAQPLASTGRADPVLSRARAALQAGRLEAPEGRNALDLFQAVLLAQPQHPEAQASLARTVDQLLARVQQEAAAGNQAEAERLAQRVLSVVPDHRAAQAVARQVNPGDTPSRQLSQEQAAEVEAQLAAHAPGPGSAVDAAPATLRPRTLAEIQAKLAELPGPVTRLPDNPSTPPAPAAAPIVRPDPLRPHVVNAATPTTTIRSYAREPAGTHPTLGMTGPSARRSSEPVTSEADMAPGVVAADTLDRVAAREPVYPAQALRNGTKGWVALEFTVAPNGSVRDIEVVAAEPRGVFDEAAADAVGAWRFRPRVVNGKAVAQRSTITMRFDVEKG